MNVIKIVFFILLGILLLYKLYYKFYINLFIIILVKFLKKLKFWKGVICLWFVGYKYEFELKEYENMFKYYMLVCFVI